MYVDVIGMQVEMIPGDRTKISIRSINHIKAKLALSELTCVVNISLTMTNLEMFTVAKISWVQVIKIAMCCQ